MFFKVHLSKYHSLGLSWLQESVLTSNQLFERMLQLTLLRVDDVGVSCSLCTVTFGLDQIKELADHLYWRHEMKNRERMLSLFNPNASVFSVYNLVEANREVFKPDHPAYCHWAPNNLINDNIKEDFIPEEYLEEDTKPILVDDMPLSLDWSLKPVVSLKKLKQEEVDLLVGLNPSAPGSPTPTKEEIATKSDSPPEVDNMEVEDPPPPQPMTQELAYFTPEMKKEDIFKVVRPVDLLGMVGRLGLMSQSGMAQDLFLLPDSANDDVIPRVLDFFRLADGVDFSADRQALFLCNICCGNFFGN